MDEGNISDAREGALVYDDNSDDELKPSSYEEHIGKVFNFIEREGLYAYSEFFVEGEWSSGYSEGIDLEMVSGGWCNSLPDLIQTLPYHPFHNMLDLIEEEESAGNIDVYTVRSSWLN